MTNNANQYRKKPVVIDAMRFEDDGAELCQWMHDAGCEMASYLLDESAVLIPTLEGVMRANPGDWIIRVVAGEFYPCKPDIFDATYEPA